MEKELSKLLGAQFDLDIDTNDVYEFLIKKNVRFFLILGTFMVGVHKRMSHPKITLKTPLWMTITFTK
jgi:hypothetical protein